MQKINLKLITNNVISLSMVQFARYLLPLLSIPYLARVLGPKGWGQVVFFQSFSAIFSLFIEYGFDLSGVREIARNSDNQLNKEKILCQVNGAKILLMIFAIVLSLICYKWINIFSSNKEIYWSSVIFAIVNALNLFWFFQGNERMKIVAFLEILSKTIFVSSIIVFIKSPGEEWKVILIQAIASFIVLAISIIIVYKNYRFNMFSYKNCIDGLRMGRSLFLIKLGTSIYNIGNTFIFGLFVPLEYVGFFAGADKIVKAARELLRPISLTFFPRISNLISRKRIEDAIIYIKFSAIGMGFGGIFIGIVLYMFSPVFVRIIFGTGYEETIISLKILSLLPFIVSMSNILGIQWMIPLGMDKQFLVIIFFASLINILLIVILGSKFFHVGMALALVLTELIISLFLFTTLLDKKLNPFIKPFVSA